MTFLLHMVVILNVYILRSEQGREEGRKKVGWSVGE